MTRGVFTKIGAAFVALIAGIALIVPSSAAGYRERSVEIAPGVVFTKIRDPKGPWSIRVVSIDLAEASTIEPVLATDKLPGLERTSAIAARYGALAAINGDYFRESGRPVMLFAQDGELAQTALLPGVNFAVDQSETTAFIGRPRAELWLAEADSGLSHAVGRFNAGAPVPGQIAGYSALGGRDEKPPYGACSARLYATEPWRAAFTRVGTAQSHVVHEVACKSGRMFPKKGRVFSAAPSTPEATSVTSLVPGENVEFGWSLGWPGVIETIGGNPTLVRNGELFIGSGSTPFFQRHPRTGVGYTDDGRVLFVTVDGRQPGYSVGMTPKRFAKLFMSLGATYALNLDGGGSTTMVVNDEIVNRPSDGRERLVGSALLLLPGADPVPVATPAPVPTSTPTPLPSVTPPPTMSPDPSTTPEPSVSPSQLIPDVPRGTTVSLDAWRAAVTDPASIGGLAYWLRSEGIRLRGSLRKAALLFSRVR
ncbi:MAG TPA: phosphodiester glycosidase family protein [Actinomycetota bacterium]|nr:phosphodiester glycosidase family protein [Actinomycetota bacterium]